MAEDSLQILKREFDAEEGSFLLSLRCDLVWDKEKFRTLVNAMQLYIEGQRDSEAIPRWIAEGFWYLESFVKDWTTHSDFPRAHSNGYYEAAYKRLHDLAYWLFCGCSPYENGTLEPFSEGARTD